MLMREHAFLLAEMESAGTFGVGVAFS